MRREPQLDVELRTAICLINDMMNNVFKYTADLPMPSNLPVIDISTTDDYKGLADVLRRKFDVIEAACDEVLKMNPQKLNNASIRAHLKYRQNELAILEKEIEKLKARIKQQEVLAAAKKKREAEEIAKEKAVVRRQISEFIGLIAKLEEERAHLLAEKKRIASKVSRMELLVAKEADIPPPDITDDDISMVLDSLELRQQALEKRKIRKQMRYARQMQELQVKEKSLAKARKQLIKKLEERQKTINDILDGTDIPMTQCVF
jgi:DNA repair exonuclease SbcCD ATPase subunit